MSFLVAQRQGVNNKIGIWMFGYNIHIMRVIITSEFKLELK